MGGSQGRSPEKSGARMLHKEAVVECSIDKVWWGWTTPKGVGSWLSEHNNVVLVQNGPYELFRDPGKPPADQGSVGCNVLAFVPPEVLVFSWNFPPTLPEIRWEHTFVVVRMASTGTNRTKVTLDQGGWRSGPQWEAGYRYFDSAWSDVMKSLEEELPKAEFDSGR